MTRSEIEEVHHVEVTKAVMLCCVMVVSAAKSHQSTDMVVDPELAKSRERALHEHSS